MSTGYVKRTADARRQKKLPHKGHKMREIEIDIFDVQLSFSLLLDISTKMLILCLC
jgi:hypothetical protein